MKQTGSVQDKRKTERDLANDFAIDELDDNVDRVAFLKAFRAGDTSDWPEFALYRIRRRLDLDAPAA